MQRALGGKNSFSWASGHSLSWGAGLRPAPSDSSNPPSQLHDCKAPFPSLIWNQIGQEDSSEQWKIWILSHLQLNTYLTFPRGEKKSVFALRQGQFRSPNFKKTLSSCERWSYKAGSKEVMKLFGRGKITNKPCLHDFQQQIGHIPSQRGSCGECHSECL